MARLRLRVAMSGVPNVIGDQWGNGSGNHLTAVRSGRSSSVLEDALVDGIDDEVADMPGAPEALGATTSNAATVAAIGGGDAERVELVGDTRTGPAVRRPGGDRCALPRPRRIGRPTWESRRGRGGGNLDPLRPSSRAGRCRRYSGLRVAARFMPSAERSRNLRRSLAAMTAWISK